MSDFTPIDHEVLLQRLSRELIDGYDEELELEIEDRDFPKDRELGSDDEKQERHAYFQELFRLQAELVKRGSERAREDRVGRHGKPPLLQHGRIVLR